MKCFPYAHIPIDYMLMNKQWMDVVDIKAKIDNSTISNSKKVKIGSTCVSKLIVLMSWGPVIHNHLKAPCVGFSPIL